MQYAFAFLVFSLVFSFGCLGFYLWAKRQQRIIRQYDVQELASDAEWNASAPAIPSPLLPAFKDAALSRPLNLAHITRNRIVTENEREFFQRLRAALPQYHICTQVAFSALLKPASGISNSEYYSILGRYSRKRVDFVACDPATMDVIAIIELDDRTHDTKRDKERDELLQAAGYIVYRFNSRQKPSVEDLSVLFSTFK